MGTRARLVVLALLMSGVVGCDQGSKELAERKLGDRPRPVVAGRVDLQYAQNRGAAFNSERVLPEAARTPVIVVGGLVLLGVLGVTLHRRRYQLSPATAGIALILGGALGNLLDRAMRGYVVDFVHVHGWPIFNVADVAIVAGALLLLVTAKGDSRDASRPGASGPGTATP
jgi:signal peptidase II